MICEVLIFAASAHRRSIDCGRFADLSLAFAACSHGAGEAPWCVKMDQAGLIIVSGRTIASNSSFVT